MKSQINNIIATAVRIEHEPEKDRVYLVFEIIDENFKQKIKEDWTQDLELQVIDRSLIQVEN